MVARVCSTLLPKPSRNVLERPSHACDRHSNVARERELEALGHGEPRGGVKWLTGQRGHELEAPEAVAVGCSPAFCDQAPAEAAAGHARVHEKRTNPCWLGRGIEQRVVGGLGLVTAEQRAASTPAAAR